MERRIYDFISLCQFKIVVFDCDGTVTDSHYTDGRRLLPCTDDGLEEYAAKTLLDSHIFANCII